MKKKLIKKKPKVAIISLTSDEGCQFVLLDLGKKLFNLFKEVELVNFSLIEDENLPSGKIDVAFVEGVPITKNDVKLLKLIRSRSKILVVIGNCAALGGVPEMKNYQGKEKTIRFIYKNTKGIANPEIKKVNNFVKVDFVIPGCPINGEEFLRLAKILITGKIPEIPQEPVCLECPKRATPNCYLVKRMICFGPITLRGCGAICPKNETICLACRGILKNINPQNFLNALEKFANKKEVEEDLEIFGVKDEIVKKVK